jgi:predicted MPP superfamily phosphohydrolase
MNPSVLSRFKQRRVRRPRQPQKLTAILQAALIEPYQVEVTYQPIKLAKLPAEFHGFRIVQLSDIHHSPFLGEAEIGEAARRANALRPDLIALTGDYVSHSRDYIAGCARALGQLRAPRGVFAVLGNHDHWTDAELMASALASEGIRVLRNECQRIEQGSTHFWLAGIDDLMAKRDDLSAALVATKRSEARILLAHNPMIIHQAARQGVDLVLSGHTHGGQINWQMLTGRGDFASVRWLRRPNSRFTRARGHANLGLTQIYVNRGLGTVVLPLRYGCPPEIAVIYLMKR